MSRASQETHAALEAAYMTQVTLLESISCCIDRGGRTEAPLDREILSPRAGVERCGKLHSE